jgi:predicted transcriptional regulator
LSSQKLLSQKLSKLEVFVEVLETLGPQQSLSIPDIEKQMQIEQAVLLSTLKLLEKESCVTCSKIGKNNFYKNTEKGIRIFRFFSQNIQTLQY